MVPHGYDLAGSILVERLRNVGHRLTLCGNRRMQVSGVSYARARILFVLSDGGAKRAVDLAKSFQQAPRTITEAIDGLERDGLVIRAADRQDRRVKYIDITDAGRTALERAIEVGVAFGDEIASVLGRDDAATLVALVERIDRYLADADDVSRSERK